MALQIDYNLQKDRDSASGTIPKYARMVFNNKPVTPINSTIPVAGAVTSFDFSLFPRFNDYISYDPPNGIFTVREDGMYLIQYMGTLVTAPANGSFFFVDFVYSPTLIDPFTFSGTQSTSFTAPIKPPNLQGLFMRFFPRHSRFQFVSGVDNNPAQTGNFIFSFHKLQ